MSSPLNAPAMDIFLRLATDPVLDSEARYAVLNAIANQLRYPNSHTHYFSCVLLSLFAEAKADGVKEQITRVLLERLIVNRPHPWVGAHSVPVCRRSCVAACSFACSFLLRRRWSWCSATPVHHLASGHGDGAGLLRSLHEPALELAPQDFIPPPCLNLLHPICQFLQGLLITFIELIKNPRYNFWAHEFTRCAPDIERLFRSVASSCMGAGGKEGGEQQGVDVGGGAGGAAGGGMQPGALLVKDSAVRG